MMEHMQIMTIGTLEMNPQIMADCAFHQFLASALTVKIAHEINPEITNIKQVKQLIMK